MSHSLSLTWGGLSVPLSSSGLFLADWQLQEPSIDDSGFYEEFINERVEVFGENATIATMQTYFRNVQLMLNRARYRWLKGRGERVFLQRTMTGDATTWRSEVIGGSFMPDPDATITWTSGQLQGSFFLRHRGYWEGPRTEIPLTNVNGTNVTGGLEVDIIDDGTRDNFVRIDGSNVLGVIPTPAEVHIQNTNLTGVSYYDFIMSLNAYYSPNTIAPAIRGVDREDAKGTTASTTMVQMNVTAGDDDFFDWSLGDALLSDTAGGDFRVMVYIDALGDNNGVWYARPWLYDHTSLLDLYEGELIELRDGWNDLGVMPLPPGGYSTNWSDHVLRLRFYNVGTLTTFVRVDQIVIAATDGNRTVVQGALQNFDQETVIDDPIENRVYSIQGDYGGGGDEYSNYSVYGPPIMLQPGEDQRLTLFITAFGNDRTWTHDVRVFYRPRILSV